MPRTASEKVAARQARDELLHRRLQKSAFNAQSGIDFTTPENDWFHRQSPYLPLDPHLKEIRLLKIHPRRSYKAHISANPHWRIRNESERQKAGIASGNQEMVACEVLDTALGRVYGQYCTVSYCAGDKSDTSLVLVDGKPFNAFSSLVHAINCIQLQWETLYPNKELLLWADQICIDQRNSEEKSYQVGMMNEIYTWCHTTFACLDTRSTQNTLAWCFNRPTRSHIAVEWESQVYPKSWPPDRQYLERDRTFVSSLWACLSSPWWRRAWICQEFILSVNPIFISGVGIRWEDLRPCLQAALSIIRSGPRTHDWMAYAIAREREVRQAWKQSDSGLQSNSGPSYGAYTFGESEDEVIDRALSTYTNLRSLDQGRRQWHSSSGRPPTPSLVGPLSAIKLAYKPPSKSRDITLAYLTRLINKAEKEGLYREAVQSDIVSQLCEFRRARDPLMAFFGRLASTRETISPLVAGRLSKLLVQSVVDDLKVTHKTIATTWKAERTELEDWQQRFKSIDTGAIWSLLHMKQEANKDWELIELLKHSRNCDATDERDRVFAFLNLASKQHEITVSYAPENTIVHVLVQTTLSLIRQSGTLDVLHHAGQGRNRRGLFIPSWVVDWTSRLQPTVLDEYAMEKMEESWSSHGTDLVLGAGTSGRFTFKPEDVINDAHNAALQVRGYHLGTLSRKHRPLTSNTELWASPLRGSDRTTTTVVTLELARPRDEVWILPGAKMPVVLRPNKETTWAFLGECVLLDRNDKFAPSMYGAAMEAFRSLSVRPVRIWIV